MSSFTRNWARQRTRSGTVYRPVLDLLFAESRGYNLYSFIVDSGADISLAPRQLAERIGIDWSKGPLVKLTGISPKPDCTIEGRTHEVKTVLPEPGLTLKLPICFADGNAPYLIGREGFFDRFRVTLDKKNLRTIFDPTQKDQNQTEARTRHIESAALKRIQKKFAGRLAQWNELEGKADKLILQAVQGRRR